MTNEHVTVELTPEREEPGGWPGLGAATFSGDPQILTTLYKSAIL